MALQTALPATLLTVLPKEFCAALEMFPQVCNLMNFSSTEILNGVIKSVKKDGEWKVTVDNQDSRKPDFYHTVFITCLSRVSSGSHCGSHGHADSVLLLQDV